MRKTSVEGGFAHTYGVELLLEAPPQISKSDLIQVLRRHCGRVDALDGDEEDGLLSFVFGDFPIIYADKMVAAQAFMAVSDKPLDAQVLEPALQQSWDWPEVRVASDRHHCTLLVTDLMSSGLDYKRRLGLFTRVVQSVVEVVSCLAIHWRRSQRLVDPAVYLASLRDADDNSPIFPAVNVRFFTIENEAPGEMLMDTLGLTALGIPDLQCHFLGLDPKEIAQMLYNSALYLYENGDVINDNETIQGLSERQRWVCRHEDSLIAPERIVLDVNPGRPYAAGGR